MAHINLLPPRLQARIAAGEVIDRPQAIVRELLDNAIDAKSSRIDVFIEGGGIDKIKVRDYGDGISREDIAVIATPHATSKIRTENDLYNINTLGFRGEALYSIQAVSKLTLSTSEKATGIKSTLVIDNGERSEILSYGPENGTEITSENLFFDIPARRSFLKRASTEAQMCRNLFISKALAFPSISFSLTIDGEKKISWNKVASLKERVMMLYKDYSIFEQDVTFLERKTEDYTVSIVATNSSVKRTDKREIRVYVNSRPVEEYSIVQAVLYGYGELLAGGSYPYCAVFINDKSELVDFNIHPAKREVKIRNLPEIHHTVSSMLKEGIERRIPEIKSYEERSLFKESGLYKAVPVPQKEADEYQKSQIAEKITPYEPKDRMWLEKAKELKRIREEEEKKKAEIKDLKEEEEDEIKYIGQAFKLFLICERKNELYLVDQHAAHERILYDEILLHKSVQKLLVPILIETDDITDEFLSSYSFVYTKLGIMLNRKEKGVWEIDAIPASCRGIEDKIINYVKSSKLDEHALEEELFASMSCHAAIKAGDEVDKYCAMEILKKVFQMEEPCCPHGRTFLIKITKENLMKMVGRTL